MKEYPYWPTTFADLHYHLKTVHKMPVSVAWPLLELGRTHKDAHKETLDHTHFTPPKGVR